MEPSNTTFETSTNRPARKGSAWWGLILIFAGAIIFAQQAGWLGPRYNWWALFILIPAFGSLTGAFYAFQHTGKFNAAVRSGLGSGLIVLTVAFIFLFGLDWSRYWPLMVIVPGFAILLGGFSRREWLNMAFWIGLGAMFLGTGFLGINLNTFDLSAVFAPNHWWAIAILIPCAGAFINALLVGLRGGRFGEVLGLVVFGLLNGATGLVAFFGMDWNLLGPALLIVAGVGILLGIFTKRT
ncbi:MAG: hypothetical protein AB1453_02560 [Chloroflexota bacterium]|jgi:hypothetical protein